MDCGFIYVNPRPDVETLSRLYHSYHLRDGKGANSWALLMNKVFKKAASFIRKQFPSGGRLLDIGCGYGHFLNLMNNYGWDTYGLEPSYPAVSYARTQRLRVTHGTLNSTRYDANYFDVITMFYVLEHLPDPVGILLEVNRILRPGGLLVLRVPHTTPIVSLFSIVGIKNNLYDLPFHLSDFSSRTIRRILEKTGYEAIHTFPGEYTLSEDRLKRFVTTFFGVTAKTLYWLSLGKFLIPGVSKTTIARKPLENG